MERDHEHIQHVRVTVALRPRRIIIPPSNVEVVRSPPCLKSNSTKNEKSLLDQTVILTQPPLYITS